MNGDVLRIDLRLRRRGIYGYTIGITLYVLVIVALYPSFKNDTSLDQLTAHGSTVAALFGANGPLTTPTGWLNANLYANFLPLILMLVTIGYGAAGLAGQDADGTLGLITTLPLSRTGIVAQKAIALVLLCLPLGVATLACALAGRGFQLSLGTGGLLGVTAGTLLLGIDFGAIAMLTGALTGSRGTALGTTAAIAAASYLLATLAPVVPWLHAARYASLFYYAVANNQLSHGLPLGSAAILTVTALAATIGAARAFERLDVR